MEILSTQISACVEGGYSELSHCISWFFSCFFFFAASNNLPKQALYRAKNYGFLIERLLEVKYLYRDCA
jgi:hypothetical protein